MADIKTILTVAAADIKTVTGTAKASIKVVGSGGALVAAVVEPSYDNPLGSGERHELITIATNLGWTYTPEYDGTPYGRLVNGLGIGCTSWAGCIGTGYASGWNSEPASGKYISFDFGSAKLMTEAKLHQYGGWLYHGYMKWQGSNDNSEWTDIGAIFRLGDDAGVGVTVYTMTELNGNTTEYRYYRLLGTSGNMANSPFVQEFTFEIN